ncbi:hypothetical protein GQX74_015674 [Glossina fuscipes]|nr:hypothetical protein GQX74_015674 [Glossina fuscipes]
MAAKIVNQVESIYARKCKNSDYGNTFLDRLNKIRINQKLSDFSLDVDGELIHVHKLAFAIASDYFAAMFETDMKERREGTVKLQDVDVVAVKALVEYIYSGIITLTEGNVEAVLSASDLLQIVWVKEECIQFLKSNLNGENCFRVRKLADMHFCQGLLDVSHTYILEHFDDLIDKEDLLLLSFEENIPGRNQNFNRATVAGNSIYSLTRRFYCTSTLLRFDPRDGKWCILNKIQEKNDQFQLVSYDRTLFALGRGDCIQLDIRVDKWEPMSCMLSERYSFSAAIAEKDIYVLGGKEEHGSPITKVERFNIYLNEWKNVDSIEIEHCDGGAAVLSGDFDFN